MKTKAPEDSTRFVASVFFKILSGAGIQEIHKARITGLVKVVNDSANQQMNIQLSP